MQKPSLRYEKNLWRKGCRFVAGIDEVGRGPLAGPVVAAAVVIKYNKIVIARSEAVAERRGNLAGGGRRRPTTRARDSFQDLAVRDSKLLSSRQREILYQKIIIHPQIDWGIGIVSEKIIDEFNILKATKLAMMKAVANLSRRPDWLLIDGNFLLPLVGGCHCEDPAPCTKSAGDVATSNHKLRRASMPQRSIIAGDKKVFSIACASIIAKVTRDKIMTDLHKIYPQYGFNQHKGYGTKLHFAKLAQCGASPIHRRSFHPVSEFVFP
ncbi:MAG: ribonuclease HII [Candidatus Portnoybacteria bacterium CG_4_10_14_0_2_um_filter_39_11]|uniref:Ribonuclease HII n=1 Tax=Candidatus Portnoybacteria bacterium CG_4_10_14_0_2_um_filter_39_11 TaxID=1974797 RepID=A0A2M7UGY6_9BACT|nr:MAG: ribonuclease HII [Parcubacteria group bacterium CG1_02_40_25]PIZ70471.1 MAG: ribonuclease HII [Candidatus Portnoybacteria bacterium CG_4_10_14_0_2_um_filter_39_11]